MAQRGPIFNCFRRGPAMRQEQGGGEAARHRRRRNDAIDVVDRWAGT
jgi:hypothetical protein